MSISIYYEVKRKLPASEAEIASVEAIAKRYSVDGEIEKYMHTGIGRNWESFDLNFNSKPSGLFKFGVIFEGSTKLPDNTENASWEGVQHWCACLSEIRKSLTGADWQLRVEDHEIQWSSTQNAFDPAS